MSVAIAHDYLTQRGGAERVVLSMLRAFPGAPLHVSLYEPSLTYPEFASEDVRPSRLNAVPVLRRRHRLALPLLAPTFSRMHVDADVVVCSSSGWAHGARTSGRKIVYCYTPARWLYQPDQYLPRSGAVRLGLRPLLSYLRRWDKRAAGTAARYLAISTVVQERVRDLYGIDAEVVPPPHSVDADGEREAVPGCSPGFVLSVSRLLPYKNVDRVVDALSKLGIELVVVGRGPHEHAIAEQAGANVRMLGTVSDAQLRWLYANAGALVSASYEDFGLTPIEAATFGTPSVVLRWGGFLDTVEEGVSGLFFDSPEPEAIAEAVQAALARSWDRSLIRAHVERFSEGAFAQRLQQVVAEEAMLARR